MKKNIGSTDRYIRLGIAFLIAILYFTGVLTGTMAMVFGFIALIMVITALLNFCPIFSLLGISSVKKEDNQK